MPDAALNRVLGRFARPSPARLRRIARWDASFSLQLSISADQIWQRPPRASNSSRSTPSAPCRWTPCRRPIRSSGHAHGLGPCGLHAYSEWLRYDPDQPGWPGRDRFVLSCGHASMLLYSVLHLAGVQAAGRAGQPTGELAVPLDDIRASANLTAAARAIPSMDMTSGIETTTGPLGQGLGNSVGMAIASRWLSANYDRPGFALFDYNVYALCSDGDMMEGISGEAASLAGHLKLPNLCWIYDDNHITIEGKTSLAFSEDVATRFEGYGWQVIHVDDINNLDARPGLGAFRQTNDRPTLIIVRSHIGYGAPQATTRPRPMAPAGGRGDPADEAGLRLAGRRRVPRARRGPPISSRDRQRGRRAAPASGSEIRRLRKQYPRAGRRDRTHSSATCPRAGTPRSSPSPPTPRVWPARESSGKVLNQAPSGSPGCWAGRPIWRPRPRR